jgi:F0F1-type ATP synthase membrane subunit c/vacuolar-type H+-ATPase subunit K
MRLGLPSFRIQGLIFSILFGLIYATPVFADYGAMDPYKSLAAAFAIGLVGFAGAMAQAKATAAALDGIGRNPAASAKFFIPMIIGLALIESLVLYAFVIAFKLAS